MDVVPGRNEATNILLNSADNTLNHAIDLGQRLGKIVVRVNFNEIGRFDGTRSHRLKLHSYRGMVERYNLDSQPNYLLLERP